MDHRQPRNRRAEIRDAGAFEASDVCRAEIAPAESDARKPGGYRPAGGQHHLRGQAVFDEGFFHGKRSRFVPAIKKNVELPFGSQEEKLV